MTIRNIYSKLLTNYWLTSLTISGTIFLIYLFFATKVENYLVFSAISISNYLVFSAISISIGYQYALIKYFFSSIRPTFAKLSHLFRNDQYQTFLQDLDKKLQKSWSFYLMIIIVVVSFVIIEGRRMYIYPFDLYPFNPMLWLLLIFDDIVKCLMLSLLAVIIWIVIKLTLIVNELKEKYAVKSVVFNIDETGGLKPLRFFVLLIISSYFIISTLVIILITPVIYLYIFHRDAYSIFYPNVNSIFYIPDIIVFIMMLLPIGVILFIKTQETIRNFSGSSEFVPSFSKPTTPISAKSYRILREFDIEEDTEILSVDELPLDNRFGSNVLTLEQEFSKSATNEISFESTHEIQGKLTADFLKLLKAELTLDLSNNLGYKHGESTTCRYTTTISVKTGDFIMYKIIWKRKIRRSKYEILVDGQHYVIPTVVRYGVEYEITSNKKIDNVESNELI